MRRPLHTGLTLGGLTLGLVGYGLLLMDSFSGGWLFPLARHAFATVLGLALVLLVLRRRRELAAVAGLAATLLVAFEIPHVAPSTNMEAWLQEEATEVQDRFQRVRQRILALEQQARDLGDGVLQRLEGIEATDLERPEQRLRCFEVLEEVLGSGRAGGSRPEPGIQLLDGEGNLIAWAGLVHAEENTTRLTRFVHGPREVYFRRCGVFTLFTYDRYDRRSSTPGAEDSVRAPALRVVIDIPVRVADQLRSRFVDSWNLEDELSTPDRRVTLEFAATSLPPYLASQDLELRADPNGSQAEFVVRGDDGFVRVLGRMNGIPLEDRIATQRIKTATMQAWLLVLALLWAMLAVQHLWLRSAGAHSWYRSFLVPVAAVWLVRILLAQLHIPNPGLGSEWLNPARFGMTGVAGLLRTPLDLLLTAFALLATATFWFLHAARSNTRRQQEQRATAARHPLRAWLGPAIAAAVVAGAVLFGVSMVGRVAANATPRLVGTEMHPLEPAVACIHLALLSGVGGLVLIVMLLVASLLPARGGTAGIGVTLVLLTVFLSLRASAVTAGLAAALFLCGAWLRALLRDDRFTSFSLAAFALVALTATVCAEAIHREYFHQREQGVLDRARSVRQLVDPKRAFVLERVLDDLQRNMALQVTLRFGPDVDRQALAFDVWAGSMLSDLGWPCQVRVYDGFGTLSSDFAVDMPYGRDTPTRELQERARLEGTRIEQTEVETSSSGRVRVYRGAVPIRVGNRLRSVVVVDLPFAHERLALAANPSSPTPGLLRPLQEEGAAEGRRDLLAWVENGVVVESSTPYLEVGRSPELPAGNTTWQALRLVNGTYHVTSVGGGERVLLVGFRRATALDRILEWTQLASLYFIVTLAVIVALIVFARIYPRARVLPALLVPKRIGFQQKLMGAFLILALLPSLVLSLATRDIMRDRSTTRNRDAALAKARSAEAALADLLSREIETVRESEYLREVLKQEDAPPVRDIGHLEFSQIMVLHGDGRLILDETLSNLSDEEARSFVELASIGMFASRDEGGQLNLGAVAPVWFSLRDGVRESAPDAELYFLYYRRRLTDGLLRDLAAILDTDISGFLGAELIVSSQRSLAIAGLLPATMPSEAFKDVVLRRNRYAVVAEHSGSQRYFAGYLPLVDRGGNRIAALAVSQLLQPDDFAVEAERTRALVVGLSTLMFVLTLVLGVAFAARIFDPVRSLIDGTRRLAGGELAFRLRARAGDEIGELERSFNDMAERLQVARVALEERRRYLEAVLGNIASGVVSTDVEGRIMAVNPAATRILGVPVEQLEGRSFHELQDDAIHGMREFWEAVVAAPEGQVVEFPLRRGADPATLRVIVTGLRTSEEKSATTLGRVAIFEDVSDLIQSKKLSAWAEMARQVAHEIKNPLTPLKSEAQFMQRAYRDRSERFDEIFTEGMQTIIQQVDALRHIASDFSNFGRVQKLKPKPVHLGDVLRSVAAPYANMDGMQVELPDGGQLSNAEMEVRADEEGLRRVFANILENAREAMHGRGRITVHIERPQEGHVQVVVRDEGQGLSPEVQRRLFEPYFSTKSTGTGLGLAISKGILEELGGSISLTNRPEGGTEARVSLVIA